MKTMVITGTSEGIGADTARQLAQRHGAQVSLVLTAQCEALGTATLVVRTDVFEQSHCTAQMAAGSRMR